MSFVLRIDILPFFLIFAQNQKHITAPLCMLLLHLIKICLLLQTFSLPLLQSILLLLWSFLGLGLLLFGLQLAFFWLVYQFIQDFSSLHLQLCLSLFPHSVVICLWWLAPHRLPPGNGSWHGFSSSFKRNLEPLIAFGICLLLGVLDLNLSEILLVTFGFFLLLFCFQLLLRFNDHLPVKLHAVGKLIKKIGVHHHQFYLPRNNRNFQDFVDWGSLHWVYNQTHFY